MPAFRVRLLPVFGALFLLASPIIPLAQRVPGGGPYFQAGQLPISVAGRTLISFTFDPTTKTLYAASDHAIYRAETSAAKPRLRELSRRRFTRIEIAPDLGKLFFLGIDEVGYVDLRAASPQAVRIAALPKPVDLAYEPANQELYVSTWRGPMIVFDAKSGERGATLDVPGWTAYDLEGTRGRVFFMLDSVFGLFTVDAATHAVAPWQVTGRISTPAQLDAAPDGRYLFMAYEREFVAIDIASATVLGRVITSKVPSIAFDPESSLLVATWDDDPPPTRIVTYAVSGNGLTETARIPNAATGRAGVEPMYGGFLQRGVRDLIVWRRRAGTEP